MKREIALVPSSPIATHVDKFSAGLQIYLAELGLPTEAVLVDIRERADVLKNLPQVAGELRDEQRQNAMYISKFVAACAAGLFDAALNYLWDETVRNLRQKVAMFDLEYFFDAVVTDSTRRGKFREATDLDKLEDWELIRGCRDTGLISPLGFRHLDYIRDMRNHASTAHPNQNDLTGLQLVAWLQTCIREVLAKAPEGAVIEVRKLLRSVREEQFTSESAGPIAQAIQRLPSSLALSLSRSVFGMYTDPILDTRVRSNIQLIASSIWAVLPEESRYELGLRHASFSANGEVARAQLAHDFLVNVNGLSHLSTDVLSLELSNLFDGLMSAHLGFNNFYTEAPFARALKPYVPPNGHVPESVVAKYVKVLTMCQIGNGYGVSWASEPVYRELIGRWQEKEIRIFCQLPPDDDVSSRLQFNLPAQTFQELAGAFCGRVTNSALKSLLEFIKSFPQNAMSRLSTDSRYTELSKAVA